MANKITKREVVTMMMADENICNNEVYMAYLENELTILNKKSSTRKSTKVQEGNIELKKVIIATLENVSGTISDIQKSNAELSAYSNQKLSALINQMVDEGIVVKTVDKKKSIFSLVEVGEVEGE